MVSAQLVSSRARNGSRVTLRIGRHTYRLSLEDAILLTHSLVTAKQYEVASRICEALVGGKVRDPRVQILLAVAKAGLEDYRACNRIIQAVFEEESKHTNWRLVAAADRREPTAHEDAPRASKAMPDISHDLVAICSLLGDLLESLGEHKKAATCWRLALQSAGANGPYDVDAPVPMSEKPQTSSPLLRRNHHRRRS